MATNVTLAGSALQTVEVDTDTYTATLLKSGGTLVNPTAVAITIVADGGTVSLVANGTLVLPRTTRSFTFACGSAASFIYTPK